MGYPVKNLNQLRRELVELCALPNPTPAELKKIALIRAELNERTLTPQ